MKIDPALKGQSFRLQDPLPLRDLPGLPGGWQVRFPGGRPLATPAVADGRVFLGGGFGSYDFVALDAATGALAWHYQTEDDGPTAAVVADGRVVFNTESCELEVLTTAGQRVWKKWLGDPLLSMPAVAGGRVFMAYPDSKSGGQHFLACFDLADGRELWRQPIAGEVITCPVLAEGAVHVALLDGNLACFDQADGQPRYHDQREATSAPAVWRSEYYFSRRRAVPSPVPGTSPSQREYMATQRVEMGTPSDEIAGTDRAADYLDHAKRQRGSPRYAAYTAHDSAVGFGGSKGDSKIHQAMLNLGHGHVSAVWSYQGSKPFLARGRVYSGLGDTVCCADAGTRDVLWQRKLREEEGELLDSPLTPPAPVNGKLFLGTLDGRVLCLRQSDGATVWEVNIKEPVLFQPAVVAGRVYVPTASGSLFCLDTGDPADDGWSMWGATPAHNGLPADRE